MDELQQGNPSGAPQGVPEGTPVIIGNLDNIYKVEEEDDTDDDGKPFVITIKQG